MKRAGRMKKSRMALAVTLGVLILRLPVSWLIQRLMPTSVNDPAVYYAALILQEAVLWGAPALLMRPWKIRRCPMDKPSAGICVMAVLVGMLAQASLMSVTAWWSQLTGAEPGGVMLPETEIQWILAVLALAVAPAILEEAFFRGGLLSGLLDAFGAAPSLMLVTVMFALAHGSLAGFPAHLGISLLCGLGMMCRGRLIVSMLMHLGYNGAALLLRDIKPEMLPALPCGILVAGAVVWMIAEIQWRGEKRKINMADAVLIGVILLGNAALYLPEVLN